MQINRDNMCPTLYSEHRSDCCFTLICFIKYQLDHMGMTNVNITQIKHGTYVTEINKSKQEDYFIYFFDNIFFSDVAIEQIKSMENNQSGVFVITEPVVVSAVKKIQDALVISFSL